MHSFFVKYRADFSADHDKGVKTGHGFVFRRLWRKKVPPERERLAGEKPRRRYEIITRSVGFLKREVLPCFAARRQAAALTVAAFFAAAGKKICCVAGCCRIAGRRQAL